MAKFIWSFGPEVWDIGAGLGLHNLGIQTTANDSHSLQSVHSTPIAIQQIETTFGLVGFSAGTQFRLPPGLNVVRGDFGDNTLSGTTGRDLIYGDRGMDILSGGGGPDILVGGRDADTYQISVFDDGNDVIADFGNAPIINGAFGSSGLDQIQLTGYGSTTEAMHSIDIEISGDDLIIYYADPSAPGQSGFVTVHNHFLSPKFGIEEVRFGTDPSDPVFHVSNLSGDNFTYSVHSGPDQGGEDIVLGTHNGEEIYGGIGNDIYYGGAGVDHFMFHDEEEHGGGDDIILDFNVGEDKIDFTDIKTLDINGVAVADNAYGNAVITTVYGTIELAGVTTAEVDNGIFEFF